MGTWAEVGDGEGEREWGIEKLAVVDLKKKKQKTYRGRLGNNMKNKVLYEAQN